MLRVIETAERVEELVSQEGEELGGLSLSELEETVRQVMKL